MGQATPAANVSDLMLLSEALVAILAAYVVYLLGLMAYRKQKEYELVLARYLDGGIDRTAANFEYALSILRQNHAHALQVIKVVRDIGAEEAVTLCDPQSFAQLDSGRMEITASHRVQQLVGSQLFWNALELLFAEAQSANFFYEKDIGSVVRLAVAQPEKIVNPTAVCDTLFSKAGEWDAKMERYYHALSALQALVTNLESQRLSLRMVGEFRNRPEVREIVRAISELFPDIRS